MAYVREQLKQAIFTAINSSEEVLAVVEFDNINLDRFELFQTKDI